MHHIDDGSAVWVRRPARNNTNNGSGAAAAWQPGIAMAADEARGVVTVRTNDDGHMAAAAAQDVELRADEAGVQVRVCVCMWDRVYGGQRGLCVRGRHEVACLPSSGTQPTKSRTSSESPTTRASTPCLLSLRQNPTTTRPTSHLEPQPLPYRPP